jgi:hypothetical protein
VYEAGNGNQTYRSYEPVSENKVLMRIFGRKRDELEKIA